MRKLVVVLVVLLALFTFIRDFPAANTTPNGPASAQLRSSLVP